MICPECESGLTTHFDLSGGLDHEEYLCDSCGAAWDFHHLLDSAELLRLIEKVDTPEWETFPFLYAVPIRKLLNAIKSYLSGDPKPLKKLAGVE